MMMRKLYYIALTLVLLWFSGCNNSQKSKTSSDISDPTHISKIYHFSENGYITNFYASLDKLVERDKNYIMYSNGFEDDVHYSVFDNYGNLLDDGYSPSGVEFSKKNNILTMKYYINATELNKVCYYDVENGRVSPFYKNSLGTSDELVCYFSRDRDDNIILVIRNIFDKSKFYVEIKRGFSEKVNEQLCPITFLNHNSEIKISYWTNEDEYVTEFIALKTGDGS